jgi:hypothetical protein
VTSAEDALAVIRGEKAFAKLSPADRGRLLAALSETQRHIDAERLYDRYGDRDLRLDNCDALKTHLTATLKVLADDVGAFDAVDWLTGHHRGDVTAAIVELRVFTHVAKRLLEGAIAFDPDPSRKGRGELQLRTDLTRRAFYELIEALESVGVRIGATSAKRGGPGSRLLALLIAYAVGFEVSPATVKDLVQKRRSSK